VDNAEKTGAPCYSECRGTETVAAEDDRMCARWPDSWICGYTGWRLAEPNAAELPPDMATPIDYWDGWYAAKAGKVAGRLQQTVGRE